MSTTTIIPVLTTPHRNHNCNHIPPLVLRKKTMMKVRKAYSFSSSVASNTLVRNNNAYIEEHMIVDEEDESVQVQVQLLPICTESQFDLIISDAQHNLVIILWMASWCRKCIYLKPKLEKLAAEYYPRLRFYCVNVNAVPHKLVSRAGVTKMPTIQLWKDGKQHSEIIGGHKGHLVVNEVREMIESEKS